jgi:formylmethanofuran dehydrogenase subunit C
VSDAVTLTLRSPLAEDIDAHDLAPDRVTLRSTAEISRIDLWHGRQRLRVGDLFDVRGERSSRMHIVGDVRRLHGIGNGMSAGTIVIDGHAGTHVGAAMSGGQIEVLGSAGDDVGLGMAGGSIVIDGPAGDRVAAGLPGAARGMMGGEVIVSGSVGVDAGARMRRGLLFVGGDAGDRVGRDMIAGTIIVRGRSGREPAIRSKRGTLVAIGGVNVPSTYRYACTYAPPHVRLALVRIRRQYHVDVSRELSSDRYRRYCGDVATIGKGEILEWTPT